MNKIIRAFALNESIRILAVDTTELISRSQKMHQTLATSTAAFGRTLTIASLMGSLIKDEKEKLRIEIRGDGPLEYIIVDAYANGNVRGLVGNPNIVMVNESNGKLDVGGAVGSGYLKVIKDIEGREPFVSTVPLQTGEIAEDFVYYFAQSEQIPSALTVGVLVNEDMSVKSAGAILFQVLPGASSEDIDRLEEKLSSLAPISELLTKQSIENILENLFDDLEILEVSQVDYRCSCHRDQMLGALQTLSADDLKELIEKDNGATLECHYCHAQFPFSADELQELIDEK